MILDETRERFLTAIARQIDPARIAEIHFFSPIRQGGVESGVAVIAAATPGALGEHTPPQDDTAVPASDDDAIAAMPLERHVIYTARYRLTLKGPDRGKWETNVNAEADAPIITVDAVVRGVQRRAGDVDDPTRMNGDEIRAALPQVG